MAYYHLSLNDSKWRTVLGIKFLCFHISQHNANWKIDLVPLITLIAAQNIFADWLRYFIAVLDVLIDESTRMFI